MEKDYYTVTEFAKEYGVSTDRVYEWVRSDYIKSLPRITTHSPWRIPKSELDRLKGESPKNVGLIITRAKEEHIEQIQQLLLDWRRDIRLKGAVAPSYPVECEQMFPFVLEHCPSLRERYEVLKRFDLRSFIKLGTNMINDLWEFAEETFKSFKLQIRAELMVEILSSIDDQLDAEQVIEFVPFNVKQLSNNEAFRDAQKVIFDKFDSDKRVLKRRKLTSYYNHLEDSLDKAIETSLHSHEYLNNRCNWCPS
jgi:hypothetical protein